MRRLKLRAVIALRGAGWRSRATSEMQTVDPMKMRDMGGSRPLASRPDKISIRGLYFIYLFINLFVYLTTCNGDKDSH